ncbi:MAG: hypothetical protein ABIF06_01280 [bacterium]
MKNSFESRSLVNIDRDKAAEKAEGVLADRIQETDFGDVYPEEKIAKDKETVENLKRKFESKQGQGDLEVKKDADIIEAIILEQGELSQWFGENAFTHGASEYDDFINGIDLLVEFKRPNNPEAEHLALGVDVTFTTDTTAKFERLRQQIEDRTLAKMDYFPFGDTESRGFKDKLPEVIVGVERRTIRELEELWLEKDQKNLEKHRIQIMILMQIGAQLDTFSEYAVSIGREDLADIYESRLRIIKKILAKKNDIYNSVALDLDMDSVHFAITDYMRRWKKVINESTKKQGESEPLSLKELLSIQQKLIVSSGLEPIEWISKYAESLRNKTQDPKIRELIRVDPEAGEKELSKRLYFEEAA